MKKALLKNFIVILVAGVILGTCATQAQAQYRIERLSDMPINRDFVIGPGKVELELKPGESRVVNLMVTNRMGDDRVFSIETEDFKGSRNLKETVVLLGNERGPYSLKDFLKVEAATFELSHGDRAIVPVTVSVPLDAEPGGRFGSVLVSTASKPVFDENGKLVPQSNTIVARIGALFFVTVPGKVKEEGLLKEFGIVGGKKWFDKGPVDFELLYENNGSSYLNPYGEITITNMLGVKVGDLKVLPWFSLPDSLRAREVSWNKELLIGRYVARASINRGYDDIIDVKEYAFWVIPWKLLGIALIVIIAFLWIVKWILSNFEIRKK